MEKGGRIHRVVLVNDLIVESDRNKPVNEQGRVEKDCVSYIFLL